MAKTVIKPVKLDAAESQRSGIRKSHVVLIVIAVALIAGLVMVASTLPSNFEVVEKGQILDYTKGKIYKVRLYDRFEFYLEPEVKPNKDVLNSAILAAVAFVSMTFAICLHCFGVQNYQTGRKYFAWIAVGALYLAADELLGIHESIGHNIPAFARIPGIDRPDDFIIIMYGLAAILFVFLFRRFLWTYRSAARWFVAALVFMASAAIADATDSRFEEYLEFLGSLSLVIGTIDLGLMNLRTQIEQRNR